VFVLPFFAHYLGAWARKPFGGVGVVAA